MFCQKCGTPCDSAANFCNSCGASLKDGSSQELTTNTNASSATMSFEKFLKTRKAAIPTSNLSINMNDQTFQDVQKRKSNERSKSIKKKKEEIVKVLNSLRKMLI